MVDDAECTLIGYQLEGILNATISSFSASKEIAIRDVEARSKVEIPIARRALGLPLLATMKNTDSDSVVTQKEGAILDCSAECHPSPTINCLKGTPADQAKLKELQATILANESIASLSFSRITRIFGAPPKGCERDDIKSNGPVLHNNGNACTFPIYFSERDEWPSVVIRYPETLSANRSEKETLARLEFIAPAEMPTITFRATDINDVWGGVVIQTSADDKGVYYQTLGGCIAMEVRTQ
nr:hypothetical protein [Cupriavidus gilardii]